MTVEELRAQYYTGLRDRLKELVTEMNQIEKTLGVVNAPEGPRKRRWSKARRQAQSIRMKQLRASGKV